MILAIDKDSALFLLQLYVRRKEQIQFTSNATLLFGFQRIDLICPRTFTYRFTMGCTNSSEIAREDQPIGISCFRDDTNVTKTLTSFNYNETQIDISHFSRGHEALGLGGFGMVRLVRKLSGHDRGTEYAMKSMSKSAIVKRSSGPCAVNTELNCLILLTECTFICQLHYAFQSSSHLFMVLELAKGGDLRHSLRATPKSRFTEDAARHLVIQIFLALDHCHRASILHRGESSCISAYYQTLFTLLYAYYIHSRVIAMCRCEA